MVSPTLRLELLYIFRTFSLPLCRTRQSLPVFFLAAKLSCNIEIITMLDLPSSTQLLPYLNSTVAPAAL